MLKKRGECKISSQRLLHSGAYSRTKLGNPHDRDALHLKCAAPQLGKDFPLKSVKQDRHQCTRDETDS